jgi:hypothetical protein
VLLLKTISRRFGFALIACGEMQSFLSRLVVPSLADIQTQAFSVQVHFVAALLKNASDVLGILEFPQVDI